MGFPVGCALLTTVGGLDSTGVPEGDADEANEAPFGLFALTVNVYGVPFDNPVTLHEVAGAFTVQVKLPGDEVTV